MLRSGGHDFTVKEEYDDGEDFPSGSLSQTFFAMQQRSGKQKYVQVKMESDTPPVMRRAAGFSASLRPSPSSCGDEESTPTGLFRAFLEPQNGSRKRLCKPVESDGYKRDGCFRSMSFETPSTLRARMASTGNTIVSSVFEKSESRLRHELGWDYRNTPKTEISTCSMESHDDITMGGVFDYDFAAFRKLTQSTTQPCISAALSALRSAAKKGQILHVEKIPARPAEHSTQDFNLHKKLTKALQERGVKRFYSHQAAAIRKVVNGSNIVAATPTASGKSMTYIIPVLNSLTKDSNSRALFIFPYKALARDQLKILTDLMAEVKRGTHCFGYDGDTDDTQKSHIRYAGKIILTTPDMLHVGILPHHNLWERFFSNLKYVVVDEAHTYRGVFGSHVGCVLRRLLRIACHYGSKPLFICCSATLANPQEHVKKLTTIDMEVINGSGAPAGEKHVLCWLPPETKHGSRRSIYKEAVKIVVALMKADLRMLVFVEARKSSEIVCKMIRDKLSQLKRIDLVEKVDSYRAGYTQEERVSLEKRLKDGHLRALVTTRALELGIDVGHLDATVHMGVPDTMCSLWQQAGRAGRRQGPSLAVIIGQERPLDVFYLKNPKKLFSRDVEQAVCNPTNPHIMRLQLPCAAQELPLCGRDVQLFGEDFMKIRDELLSEGILHFMTCPKGNALYVYRFDDHPASEVSIRGISKSKFQLLNKNGTVVEEVDEKMALRMLYEGAIYRRARDTFRIKNLDIQKKQAVGELYEDHHMTEVIMKTKVLILEKKASRATLGTQIYFGKLEVIEHVTGYNEFDVMKNKQIGTVSLNYPPSVLRTIGVWWDVPAETMQKLSHMAYEALSVLRRVVLPLLAAMSMSDVTDMYGLETLIHEQTEQPQIFLYDALDGGIGIAEQAYKDVEYAWRQALNVLQRCDCKFGCPTCTRSASSNVTSESHSSKHAAILLLECLLCIRKPAPSAGTPSYLHMNPLPRSW